MSKKLLTLLLLSALLLCVPALAEAPYTSIARDDGGILCAAGSEGTFVYADQQVIYYPEEGDPIPIISLPGVTRIAGYCYNVYLLTEANRIYGYDLRGNMIYLADLPERYFVQQFAVTNDNIYLLALPRSVMDGQFPTSFNVYKAIMVEGTTSLEPTLLSVRSWENGNINAISMHEGVLYTYDIKNSIISALNPVKRTLLARRQYASSALRYLQGASTGDGTYAVYLLEGTTLYYANLSNGDFTAELFDIPLGATGLFATKNALYTRSGGARELLRLHLRSASDKASELVIWYVENDARAQAATRLFHQRYPDMKVVFQNDDFSYALLSNMNSGLIDLVSTRGMSQADLLRSLRTGLLQDLSGLAELNQHMTAYKDIFSASYYGKMLYGMPLELSAELWLANEALLNEVGLSLPAANWDWSTLRAMAETLQRYNQAHGTRYYLLADSVTYPYLMDQINALALDLQTGKGNYLQRPVTDALSAWQEITQAGLVKQANDLTGGDALFTIQQVSSVCHMQDHAYVTPPRLGSETVPLVQVDQLVVNAKSPRKEEALHFLTCYMDPQVFSCGLNYLSRRGLLLNDPTQTAIDQATSRANQSLLAQALADACDPPVPATVRNRQAELFAALPSGELTPTDLAIQLQEQTEALLEAFY